MRFNITIPDEHEDAIIDALSRSAGLEPSRDNARTALLRHIEVTTNNVMRADAERAAMEALEVKPVEL